METILNKLHMTFQAKDFKRQREDLLFITLPGEMLKPALLYLRDQENFSHLSFITAIDYIEKDIFTITYMVHSHLHNKSLGVYVEVPREEPVMEGVHDMWEQAVTYQKELKEMFGIDFPGSPEINEEFLLEGWEGPPPMRREFDTQKYSEETYFPRPGRESHDPTEHMKKVLFQTEAEQ